MATYDAVHGPTPRTAVSAARTSPGSACPSRRSSAAGGQPRHRHERLRARAREWKRGRIGLRERRGGREAMGQPPVRLRERLAVLGHAALRAPCARPRRRPAGRRSRAQPFRSRRRRPARAGRGGGGPAARAAGRARARRRWSQGLRQGRTAAGSAPRRRRRRPGRRARSSQPTPAASGVAATTTPPRSRTAVRR